MSTFKPTVVASSLAIAFSSSVLAANFHQAPATPHTINKSSANFSKQLNKQQVQQRNQQIATVTGMRNQFDSNLNQQTFVWRSVEQRKPDLQMIAPEQRSSYAAEYYLKGLTGSTTDAKSSIYAKLKYIDQRKSGPILAKYKQEIQGIELFNKEYNVMMDREYNLVAGSGYLAKPLSAGEVLNLMSGFNTAENAVQRALKDLSKGALDVALEQGAMTNSYQSFKAGESAGQYRVIGEPRAKKVFYEHKGKQIAAYYVEVEIALKDSLESSHYNYVIGGKSNQILFRNNLRAHAADFTYRAYAHQSGFPMEGPHGDVIPAAAPGNDKSELEAANLVTMSHYESLSTQDPWLADDATTTSGNNVFAYADVVAPQGYNDGDIVAEVTSDKTFDYQLSDDDTANSLANRKAAIVNMFYFNNFMHDFYYDFGFDEAAGNAQLDNYGRGGVEGDPLEVQAQDYSGFNNANMSTPADGRSPRMQQYLYTDKDAINGEDWGITVTSHSDIGLLVSSQLASFGPVQYAGVSGSLVRLNDGNDTDSDSVYDGCEEATNSADNGNDLTGKIAVIDRGGCNFTAKVKHAQQAGAIAAIVVNNVDNGTPAPMGGSDDEVTIPSMGLNFAEGASLYALMDAGEEVSVEMFSTFPLKDSSFDNGIIAHEWGHYIQNRLVGNASGLVNIQGRAMGEGWSDIHSMIFLVKEQDREITGNAEYQVPYATGTYVEDFYFGIRRTPYTPNMEINPLTFKHITANAEPNGLRPTRLIEGAASVHDAGEMWATVLWDVYVGLLNKYDFTEAQSRFVNYLVMGYKMTPLAPTYTEARDAILAAIYANDQEDYQQALSAFARRGLGLDAVAPARFSQELEGVQEGFATQLSSYQANNFSFSANFDGIEQGYCTADGILDKGETGTVSVTVSNKGSEALIGAQVQFVVTSDHDVTFENDGLVTLPDLAPYETVSTGGIKLTLNDAAIADSLTVEVRFPELAEGDDIVEPAALQLTSLVNLDFEVVENTNNSLNTDMESYALLNDFKENVMSGGSSAVGTRTIDSRNPANFFQGFNPEIDLGNQAMLLVNNGFASDVAAETDYIQVGYESDFSLNFWHFYWIEAGYDGGVVEISINDAPWVDVTEAGATFAVGYNQTLFEEPTQVLRGRNAYSGLNSDFQTFAGNMETISFGSALNGQTVRLRFRMGSDIGFNEFGWVIDNLSVTNVVNDVFSKVVTGETEHCDNSAPKLSVSAPSSVSETGTGTITASATDRNNDSITYSWTQTAGADATLTADGATLSFTPPSITSDTELTFMVTASDGKAQVSESVNVTITNVNPAPPPPPVQTRSSGGGSLGLLSLALTPLLWFRRRKLN